MNTTLYKLNNNETVRGVLSPSGDPTLVEIIGYSGYNYFMVDGEHTQPIDLQSICRAAELCGITALARVKSNDPKLVLQYLDSGFKGLMLPSIKGANEVIDFIDSLKYPPEGSRGFGPSRANNFLVNGLPVSLSETNSEIMAIIQIETTEAYDQLDEILSVDGIDLIVIGAADLSLSMNLPMGGVEITNVIKEIVRRTISNKIPVGLVISNIDELKEWKSLGVQFFIQTLGNIIQKGNY